MTHYFSSVQKKLSPLFSSVQPTVHISAYLVDKNGIYQKSNLDQFHATIPFSSLSDTKQITSLFSELLDVEKYSFTIYEKDIKDTKETKEKDNTFHYEVECSLNK